MSGLGFCPGSSVPVEWAGCWVRRYLDNMTSERVDSEGVANIAKFAQQLPKSVNKDVIILPMGNEKDLQACIRLEQTLCTWSPICFRCRLETRKALEMYVVI